MQASKPDVEKLHEAMEVIYNCKLLSHDSFLQGLKNNSATLTNPLNDVLYILFRDLGQTKAFLLTSYVVALTRYFVVIRFTFNFQVF